MVFSSRSFAVSAATFALALTATAALAQDVVPNRATAEVVRKNFLSDLDTLQARFLALAETIPADKYSWRPAPGVRSFGEVFQHIASEYYLYTPLAYGATPSPIIGRGREAMKAFESKSTKADMLTNLRDGFAYTKQVLNAMPADSLVGTKQMFGGEHTIIETSFRMGGDLHEHLGQLIAYARVNGIKPPWSK